MIAAYQGVPGAYKTHDAVKQIISFMVEALYKAFNPDVRRLPSYPAMLKGNHAKREAGLEPVGKLKHIYTNIRGFGIGEYGVVLQSLTGWNQYDVDEYVHSLTDFEMIAHFGTIDRGEYEIDDSGQVIEDNNGKPKINTNKGRVSQCLFERNCVIAVDEVHTLFNCRDFNSDGNRAFTYYGTYHRHENSHMLLITHEMEKVDRQIRDLIQISYYFEQVLFFGSKGKSHYMRHMYRGSETKGKAVHKTNQQIDQGAINCYQTTKSGEVDGFEFIKTPNLLLRQPVMYAIPVVFLLAILCLYRAAGSNGLIGTLTGGAKVKKNGVVPLRKLNPTITVVAPSGKTATVTFPNRSTALAAAPESLPVASPESIANINSPVIGCINLAGKFYILHANGSCEQGKLTKSCKYRIKQGVGNNVTKYAGSSGMSFPSTLGNKLASLVKPVGSVPDGVGGSDAGGSALRQVHALGGTVPGGQK